MVPRFALACSILAAATLAAAGWGMFVAIGLGLFSAGLGLAVYRTRGNAAEARQTGAAAAAHGVIAVVLGSAKVALSVAAVSALARLVS